MSRCDEFTRRRRIITSREQRPRADGRRTTLAGPTSRSPRPLEGEGTYHDAHRLIDVAETVVDRPQRATLDVGLAPEGWSIQFFKMGRVLTLVNDAYEQQTLTVHIPLPEDVIPAEHVRASIMGPVGPQLDVTVNGRPAQLVLCEAGYLDERIWYLQAQFEEGTTFVLQVPDSLTQDQVLELAETVTYNP